MSASNGGMWSSLRRQFGRLCARVPFGAGRECVLCGAHVGYFVPFEGGWKNAPAVVRTMNVIGSDLDHYLCPACQSNDRERHLFLFLREGGILAAMRGKALLQFAPEKRLTPLIERVGLSRHVKGDLFPASRHVERIDMLAIPMPDSAFDFVMANHVLEHVDDDLAALKELRRVLRPGGLAILQTPYSEVLEQTECDPQVSSERERTERYGQKDHVRLYGRDIFSRFASVGFTSRVATHAQALPGFDPARYGVNWHEPFFLFERTG